MSVNNTKNPYVEKVKNIILAKLKDHSVRVYLFGSRANNTAHTRSDVDVGVLPKEAPLPEFLLAMLKDELEESDVPYSVDLLDLSRCDKDFREKVISTGRVWRD